MKKILLQFDTDSHASSFDRVVAVDSGVDQLFSYGDVTPDNVTGLVHGAIFTRGPADLKNTAIFVGGSNVQAGESLLAAVKAAFFGPMRVSVMMDSNGCNTTAAAAVVAAKKHLKLSDSKATVLGGTGPVGQRVAQLLASEGCDVTVVSRSQDKAANVCDYIAGRTERGTLHPVGAAETGQFVAACEQRDLVVACGAAGISFLPAGSLSSLPDLKLAVDLNAVPPLGLGDVEAMDRGVEKEGTLCYGALGVGGTKMKVHKRAIAQLFDSSDATFDTAEIYQLACEVAGV